MNYEAMPILTVEIERLKHSIQTMLGTHGSELGSRLAESVDKAVKNYDIDSKVNECVSAAVDKSIEEYFKYGEARREIDKMVKNAFSQDAKEG